MSVLHESIVFYCIIGPTSNSNPKHFNYSDQINRAERKLTKITEDTNALYSLSMLTLSALQDIPYVIK